MSHVAGYEVIRFGVPMTGEYTYLNRESVQQRVIISPTTVPGAQYKIIAWAIGNGSRSARPAVWNRATREAGELQQQLVLWSNITTLYNTICIIITPFNHR